MAGVAHRVPFHDRPHHSPPHPLTRVVAPPLSARPVVPGCSLDGAPAAHCRCSKAIDVDSRSLVERARLRREADDMEVDQAGATFGFFQPLAIITALVLLGLMALTVLLGCGAVPPLVWGGAIAVGVCTLLVALLGTCLNRYHRRDEAHAAKTMRPGALLGAYLTLLMAACLMSATLGSAALSSVPASMQYVLQNWQWVKSKALPFSEPLETAQTVANNTSHLAICAIVLASFQALALVNCCSLLSRRGALALVPFALHATALLLGVGGIAIAFAYGPTACAASLAGCTAVKGAALCCLLLVMLALSRMGLDPGASDALCGGYSVAAGGLLAGFAFCAAVLGDQAEHAVGAVTASWDAISLALPPDAYSCTGDPSALYAAKAQQAYGILTTVCAAALLVLLLLLLLACYERTPCFAARRRRRRPRRPYSGVVVAPPRARRSRSRRTAPAGGGRRRRSRSCTPSRGADAARRRYENGGGGGGGGGSDGGGAAAFGAANELSPARASARSPTRRRVAPCGGRRRAAAAAAAA